MFLCGTSVHIQSHSENTSAANLFTLTTLTAFYHNLTHTCLYKVEIATFSETCKP